MRKHKHQIRHSIITTFILLCILLIPTGVKAAVKPGKIDFIKATTSNSNKGISSKAKSKGYKKVVLSWTASKHATKYKIMYSYKKTGTYKQATSTTYVKGEKAGKWRKCTLAYPNNKKIFFKVIPYNNSTKGYISDYAAVKVGNEKSNASNISLKKYYKTVYIGGKKGKFVAKANRGLTKAVRWKSSDTSIATVDKTSGLVKGKKIGTVKIYAIAHNGVRKYIRVKVKKSGTNRINGIPTAPTLKYVSMCPQNENATTSKNHIVWSAIKGKKYQILRKSSGKYRVISTVKAKSTTPSYIDKTGYVSTRYTYSVRMIEKNGTYTVKGKYDTAGIRTLPPLKSLDVDSQNLKSSLTWDKVNGATSYTIYRKAHKSGTYRALGETSNLNYTDIYRNSSLDNADSKYLCDDYFVDPSRNPFIYQIRANYSTTDSNGNKKYSYSYYYKDGFYELLSTAIVRFEFKKNSKNEGTLYWSPVNRSTGYWIYKSKNGKEWTRILSMKKIPEAPLQYATLPYDANYPYYTVVAYSQRNGKTIYGGHDEGFYVNYTKEYTNKNVLFLGNSITYGSPYKGDTTRHIYSYPYRVGQLLGVKYFNPSIPGSTYSYVGAQKTNYRRYRIYEEVALPIATGVWPTPSELFPDDAKTNLISSRDWFEDNLKVQLPDPKSVSGSNYLDYTYDNYDVVIMAAGTNDYGDNDPFTKYSSDGENLIDNTDTTNMTGTINSIMNLIKEGSEKRIAAGKKPIKVIMLDFFYSDRLYTFSQRQNRFKTKNNIGYTLTDYQNQMTKLINRYEKMYDGEDASNPDSNVLDIFHFKTNEDYDFINEDTCPYNSSDNLHMNRFTYTQIGNALAEYLKENCFSE